MQQGANRVVRALSFLQNFVPRACHSAATTTSEASEAEERDRAWSWDDARVVSEPTAAAPDIKIGRHTSELQSQALRG
jgi:hypothetical protein